MLRHQHPKKGGHLRVGISTGDSTDTLDPRLFIDSFLHNVAYQLYNALVEIDENDRLIPELATEWEYSNGAKRLTMKLRKGVQFHNGKTMTSNDVKYSIELHMGKTKSGARGIVSNIDNIKIVNKNEIEFNLKRPNVDFVYMLSDVRLVVVPENANFDEGIGTGGYILEHFQPGVKFVSSRNKNYWKSNRAHVDSVELLSIKEPQARVAALLSGQVDAINRVNSKIANLIQSSSKVKLINNTSKMHHVMVARCDRNPFSDINARLGLKYATDRQKMLDIALNGFGSIGNDNPMPSSDPFYAHDLPQTPFDLDRAKYHFKKAGVDKFQFDTSDAAYVGAVDMATILSESLKNINVSVKVNRVPADGYWKHTWRKKPLCSSYWSGRPVSSMLLEIGYRSTAPYNDTGWKSSKFDQSLDAVLRETNFDKRKAIFADLQEMINIQGGTVVPTFANHIEAIANNVKGFKPLSGYELAGAKLAERVWLA